VCLWGVWFVFGVVLLVGRNYLYVSWVSISMMVVVEIRWVVVGMLMYMSRVLSRVLVMLLIDYDVWKCGIMCWLRWCLILVFLMFIVMF